MDTKKCKPVLLYLLGLCLLCGMPFLASCNILPAAAAESPSTALPVESEMPPSQADCDLPSNLNVNGWAQNTSGLSLPIHAAPGKTEEVIGEITAGTAVRMLEGPTCADGSYWWKVDAGLVSGWMPEGGDGTYWLSPITDEMSVPVEGWIGAIVSATEWPQIDDYFQMLDQGGSRYGILSLDPVVNQQLEAHRDTGTLVQIWGTLYYNRMDAYNAQIEVTRLEVYEPAANNQEDSWVGVVVSNPPGAQFDDYFQGMDQNGTRYGIDSLNETIRQQLVELRGSEQIIRVWGTLLSDVPDAYGQQIQVTRLELEP